MTIIDHYQFHHINNKIELNNVVLNQLQLPNEFQTFELNLPIKTPRFFQNLDFDYMNFSNKKVKKLKHKLFFKLIQYMKKISQYTFLEFESLMMTQKDHTLLIVNFLDNRLDISLNNLEIKALQYHANESLMPTLKDLFKNQF